MKFESPFQHSLPQLRRLVRTTEGEMSLNQALLLTHALVPHGHPAVLKALSRLEGSGHSEARQLVSRSYETYHAIRSVYRIEELAEAHLAMLYRKEGWFYWSSPGGSRKLLVVFTTMFNNFDLSIPALICFLSGIGCNLLILRDTSQCHYLNGIADFAPDIPTIAAEIRAVADRNGDDEIYLTGFSSSGYVALTVSLLLECHGYLGFSHTTDMHAGSPLEPPRLFTPEVRALVGESWLQDLRPLLAAADPVVPRLLVYGERSLRDVAHAQHLAGLPAVTLQALPDTGHSSVLELVRRGELIASFRRLVQPAGFCAASASSSDSDVSSST